MTQESQANESDEFPFLELPFFAKEEMLGHLECYEIFDTSTLSKRTARVIRSSGQFIPVVSLNVTIYESVNLVSISANNGRTDHRYYFNYISSDDHSKLKTRNLGGVDVLIQDQDEYCSWFQSRSVECPAGKMDMFTDAVIRHIFFIFQKCIVNRISIGRNFPSAKEALSAITQTKNLIVRPDGTDNRHQCVIPRMRVTQEYWNNCEEYNEGPTVEDIECTDRIMVDNSSSIPLELLMNANCSNIHLKRSSYNAEDLVNFLKKWEKSTGDDMKNIKFVVIETTLAIGNLDLSNLNVMQLGVPYIKRSDGKEGSILHEPPNHFCFDVSKYMVNEKSLPVSVPSSQAAVPVTAAPVTVAALDTSQDLRHYKLKSSDNQIFEISHKALKFFQVLSDLIATVCTLDKKDCEPIPLDNIRGNILKLIVDWAEGHKNEPIPTRSSPKDILISSFESSLLDITRRELFDLICAANYLDIQPLLWITCKKAASFIKGKLPEEIRAIYCIPTDEEDEAAEQAAGEAREQASKKNEEGCSSA